MRPRRLPPTRVTEDALHRMWFYEPIARPSAASRTRCRPDRHRPAYGDAGFRTTLLMPLVWEVPVVVLVHAGCGVMWPEARDVHGGWWLASGLVRRRARADESGPPARRYGRSTQSGQGAGLLREAVAPGSPAVVARTRLLDEALLQRRRRGLTGDVVGGVCGLDRELHGRGRTRRSRERPEFLGVPRTALYRRHRLRAPVALEFPTQHDRGQISVVGHVG